MMGKLNIYRNVQDLIGNTPVVFSSCRSASSFLPSQQDAQTLGALIGEDADFILQIALQTLDLGFFD